MDLCLKIINAYNKKHNVQKIAQYVKLIENSQVV